MECTICHEKIVLIPSATERAKKYGGEPSYYTSLFTTHSQCFIKKRDEETIALLRKTVTIKATMGGGKLSKFLEVM